MQEKAYTRRPVPWGSLAAMVGIAALVRVVVRGMTPVIGADGPAFLEIAGQFARGDIGGALGHDYHPLYPALVAAVSRVGPGMESAATAVSFLFGILLPVPLFFLARRSLGDRVGLGAGLLVAFHPVAARLSVDQKSDSLYVFLFVAAAGVLWEGIRSRRPVLLGAGGLAAGLAYLARPEGLGMIVVACGWLLLSRRRALLIGCLLLGAAIPGAPYIAAISVKEGTFRITRKKGISDFLGTAPRRAGPNGLCLLPLEIPTGEGTPARRLREHGHEMGAIQKTGWAALEVILEVVKTVHPALLFFLLVGLLRVRAIPRRRDQDAFLMSNLIFYGVILFLLVLGVHYLSRRHVFPLAVLVLPWVVAGGWETVEWAAPRICRRERLAILLFGGLVLLLAVKAFYPVRLDQLSQKEVGTWIRTVSEGKATHVLTPQEKVAYYAGARWVPFSPEYQATLDIGRHHRARYVVFIREKVHRVCPGFVQAIREEDLERKLTFITLEKALFGKPRELHLDVYEIR